MTIIDAETKRKLREMGAPSLVEALEAHDDALTLGMPFAERIQLVVDDSPCNVQPRQSRGADPRQQGEQFRGQRRSWAADLGGRGGDHRRSPSRPSAAQAVVPWVRLACSPCLACPDPGPGGPMVLDRGQISLGEPAVHGGVPERGVDLGGPEQPGQLQGSGHLHPDPGGAGLGRLGQPQTGTRADGQERQLRGAARAWGAAQSTFGNGWEMRVIDARAARRRPGVAGHLDRAGRPDVSDHDLLTVPGTVDTHPDALAEQLVGHRVLPGLETHHRGVHRHLAGSGRTRR